MKLTYADLDGTLTTYTVRIPDVDSEEIELCFEEQYA